MKYIDEFRDGEIGQRLVQRIAQQMDGAGEVALMEVCGTHTMAIFRYGIRGLLPENIRLLSGPGCPVCVTPNSSIDKAVAYARLPGVVVATFGDMLRVPGSRSSLEREGAERGNVKVVYSTMDALELAVRHPELRVVFVGVGFETTAPTIAASIVEAERRGIDNYFILCAHKLIPPVMEVLVSSDDLAIDGFICPGHVSAIIGSNAYRFIPRDHGVPCVVAGFEPLDIIEGVYMLAFQIRGQTPRVENQYRRVVRPEGNPKALALMEEAFEVVDSEWRGIGVVPGSGLKIRDKYSRFDAEANMAIEVESTKTQKGCICGDVLRGVKTPPDCKLFQTICTPMSPVGPCMVSSEGTCAAFYKYSEG